MKLQKHLQGGQALIECIGFVGALAILLSIMLSFTQWFLARQKLLMAVREGALLYSSGYLKPAEVEQRLRGFLTQGTPMFDGSRLTFYIGRAQGLQAQAFSLDEIRIQYQPHSLWIQQLQPIMEEKCTIKHAPHYGPPLITAWGPPISW